MKKFTKIMVVMGFVFLMSGKTFAQDYAHQSSVEMIAGFMGDIAGDLRNTKSELDSLKVVVATRDSADQAKASKKDELKSELSNYLGYKLCLELADDGYTEIKAEKAQSVCRELYFPKRAISDEQIQDLTRKRMHSLLDAKIANIPDSAVAPKPDPAKVDSAK